LDTLVKALRKLQGAGQAPPGDRYCLKPPTSGGNSDVKQFIHEFENVATIAEWPAPVHVLQLRVCLTGWARSFALRPDEVYIMRALPTRFGLAAQEARDKLQGQ